MSNKSKNCDKKEISFTGCSKIDAGTFGVIYLVRKNGGIDDARKYAMKSIQCNKKQGCDQNSLRNEIDILKLVVLKPFFVQLKYSWTACNEFNIVMEYMPCGTLFNYVNEGTLTLEEAKICSAEIFCAIKYLHENQIVYRDLKLENILVSSDGHIQLTDFGLARKVEPDELLYDKVGTLQYFAPEILNQSGHSLEVDWWTLGITIYELIVGHSPFTKVLNEVISDKNLCRRILNDEPGMAKLIATVTGDVIPIGDFIRKLLIKDRTQRLGAGNRGYDEIKVHMFFLPLNWFAVRLRKYDCLRRHLEPKPLMSKIRRKWTAVLKKPESPNEKDLYYIAPEFEEPELFYGFTADDLDNRPQIIPPPKTMHNLQVNGTFIRTTSVAGVLKQLISSKKTVMPLMPTNQNCQNAPRRSERKLGAKRRARTNSSV